MTDSVKALKAQLVQLDALHQSGALSEGAWRESKTSLERRLVDLVMQGGPESGPAQLREQAGWKLWLACGSFAVVIAVSGYAWKGSPRLAGAPVAAAAVTGSDGAQPASQSPDPEQVAAMVATLAERLKSRPDDGEGWTMLARSYAALGRVPEALEAYKKAITLRDKDATLLADYADALAYSRGGEVKGEPVQLVARALKLDPVNTKSLALAGSFAFAQADYAKAIVHWEKLMSLAPPGTPVDEIERAIAQARERLATVAPQASAAQKKPASTAANASSAVSGVVTLSPAIASQVRPDDTLFVVARPVDGSRMPLAVLRRQAKDLPLTFSLDNSMAMSNDRVISSAGTVIISARISRSGNAMPQAGDISTQTDAVKVGSEGVRLELGAAARP